MAFDTSGEEKDRHKERETQRTHYTHNGTLYHSEIPLCVITDRANTRHLLPETDNNTHCRAWKVSVCVCALSDYPVSAMAKTMSILS